MQNQQKIKYISQVGSAIDACSSSNTVASLKAAIAQGVANKALADQVPVSQINLFSNNQTQDFFC